MRARARADLNVLYVRLDHRHDAAAIRRLASQCSPERLRRAGRYRLEEDYRRSIAAEALVHYSCMSRYNVRGREDAWGYGPSGKPYLAQRPELCFNLTHSGDGVACAFGVGLGDIGIDLERMQPIAYEAIAAAHFTAGENRYLALQHADRRLDAFYRVWTLKESCLKATGIGLGMPMAGYDIRGLANSAPYVDVPSGRLHLRSTVPEPGYWLSVCASRPFGGIRVHTVPLAALIE